MFSNKSTQANVYRNKCKKFVVRRRVLPYTLCESEAALGYLLTGWTDSSPTISVHGRHQRPLLDTTGKIPKRFYGDYRDSMLPFKFDKCANASGDVDDVDVLFMRFVGLFLALIFRVWLMWESGT